MKEIQPYTPPRAVRLFEVLETVDAFPDHSHYIAVKDTATMAVLAKCLSGRRRVVLVTHSGKLIPNAPWSTAQKDFKAALAAMEIGLHNVLIGPLNMLGMGWETQREKVVLSCTEDLDINSAATFAHRGQRIKNIHKDVHLCIFTKRTIPNENNNVKRLGSRGSKR